MFGVYLRDLYQVRGGSVYAVTCQELHLCFSKSYFTTWLKGELFSFCSPFVQCAFEFTHQLKMQATDSHRNFLIKNKKGKKISKSIRKKKGMSFQHTHSTHITEGYKDSPPRYISKQLNRKKQI